MTISDTELSERILHEKRLFAQEVQSEAWADGISEGIEPEILASAGMETIVSLLMRECGPQAVYELLACVSNRVESGEFLSHEYIN